MKQGPVIRRLECPVCDKATRQIDYPGKSYRYCEDCGYKIHYEKDEKEN